MTITTINPANATPLVHYELMSETEVDTIINLNYRAFVSWAKLSFVKRAEYLSKIADLLLTNKKNYATLITTEMGKPFKSAIEEIEKCAWVCRFFAEKAEDYLASRIIKTEMSKSYVTYNPLGIVFAIMPWNFPFWQVFRFAAPALMAGNSILLKHAPNTTGCGIEIEKIFKEANLPSNLFRTLVMDTTLAATVIQHPKTAAVTVTGSKKTGKIVAGIAGNAIKKIVLELGGNDPYIILEDADLELAAQAAVASRMNNAGQSCIAAKRLLAVKSIREEFQKQVLKELQKYILGENLGPLARSDLRDNLHRQVQESVQKGATLLTGGMIPKEPGFYYPPTVLTNVKKGMPAYDEELFGPVITFIDVKDEPEAIFIANETNYGLSAAIFTRDSKRGEKIAVEDIKAGTVFVNAFVRSDPRLPFGGIKDSGIGRELGREGIHEFVNSKTIGIK